jgi:hypothetical protein
MRRYLVLVAVIALSTTATLGQTPALAAGITDQCWTVQELLAFHIPPPWQPPKRRGRSSKVLQSLIKRWRCLTTVKCGATPQRPKHYQGANMKKYHFLNLFIVLIILSVTILIGFDYSSAVKPQSKMKRSVGEMHFYPDSVTPPSQVFRAENQMEKLRIKLHVRKR